MKKSSSFGTILFAVLIALAYIYYKSRHPTVTATTAPGHVVAFTPGGDSLSVQDDKTQAVAVVFSLIDPKTHHGEEKLDPTIKVGDKGTLFYESPSGRVEFQPDPK